MNEVIEQAVINQRGLDVAHAPPRARRHLPASLRMRELGGLRPATPTPTRWQSSLCDADLLCLLQVIEADLIPRLISGYSPALCSPQDLRTAEDESGLPDVFRPDRTIG